jgi:hypothetical protein
MIKHQIQNTNNSSHNQGLLYDYIQQQSQNKISYNAKTPIKVGVKERGKVNYSEILEVSPSSNDKSNFRKML